MKILSKLKIVLLIASLVFLGRGGYDFYIDHAGATNYNQATEKDISRFRILEGDLSENYGYFQKSYMTQNGSKSGKTRYCYVIPIHEKYIGIEVREGELRDSLEAQAASGQPSAIHFRGIIKSMDQETKKNFEDYLLNSGFNEGQLEQVMLPYYIDSRAYDEWLFFFAAGFVLMAAFLVLVIRRR